MEATASFRRIRCPRLPPSRQGCSQWSRGVGIMCLLQVAGTGEVRFSGFGSSGGDPILELCSPASRSRRCALQRRLGVWEIYLGRIGPAFVTSSGYDDDGLSRAGSVHVKWMATGSSGALLRLGRMKTMDLESHGHGDAPRPTSHIGEGSAVRGGRVHRLTKRLCPRWCFFGPGYDGLLPLLSPAALPRWWRSAAVGNMHKHLQGCDCNLSHLGVFCANVPGHLPSLCLVWDCVCCNMQVREDVP